MIIIMKPNASTEAVQKVTSIIEHKGLQAHYPKATRSPSSVWSVIRANFREPISKFRKVLTRWCL